MTSTAAALAEQVSRRLEPVYTLLDRVADEVLRCRPARAPLTEANLAALHRMLADLIAAEQARDARQVALFGVSLGGLLAYQAAGRAPGEKAATGTLRGPSRTRSRSTACSTRSAARSTSPSSSDCAISCSAKTGRRPSSDWGRGTSPPPTCAEPRHSVALPPRC